MERAIGETVGVLGTVLDNHPCYTGTRLNTLKTLQCMCKEKGGKESSGDV